MEVLAAAAKQLDVSPGAVIEWLLPPADRALARSKGWRPNIPEAHRRALTARQVVYLSRGAKSLRDFLGTGVPLSGSLSTALQALRTIVAIVKALTACAAELERSSAAVLWSGAEENSRGAANE